MGRVCLWAVGGYSWVFRGSERSRFRRLFLVMMMLSLMMMMMMMLGLGRFVGGLGLRVVRFGGCGCGGVGYGGLLLWM